MLMSHARGKICQLQELYVEELEKAFLADFCLPRPADNDPLLTVGLA